MLQNFLKSSSSLDRNCNLVTVEKASLTLRGDTGMTFAELDNMFSKRCEIDKIHDARS